MLQNIYNQITTDSKKIAILIDPEKCQDEALLALLLNKIKFAKVDFIFIGGSTVTREEMQNTVAFIKQNTDIPLVIFPGASHQISKDADALLYLSLISGRNPDYLIGHHVQSASELEKLHLEIIPTAYILIDGGTKSSVAYVSQTTPIPRDHISILKNTALAGKFLGHKLLYLDAGSGAIHSVPTKMIREIKSLNLPIIVGGGVSDLTTINEMHEAGANIVVIGNKLEENIDFLLDIKSYIENQSAS
jgi:phosphoglycerol geranylgeranyltransferase